MSYLKYGLLIFFLVFTSCSKDGEDGAIGPKGEDGAIGPKGEDGIDGVSGIDGVAGNANVTTYIFNEPQWSNGNPLIVLDMTGILTTDVLTNDAVLVYVRSNTGQNSQKVFQIPGWVHGSFPNYPLQMITPYFTDSEGGAGGFQIPERIYISTRSVDNVTILTSEAVPLSWIRVVIIKTANTITGKSNKGLASKDKVLNKLKIAGVDVNNYHAVCKFYGIAPE